MPNASDWVGGGKGGLVMLSAGDQLQDTASAGVPSLAGRRVGMRRLAK